MLINEFIRKKEVTTAPGAGLSFSFKRAESGLTEIENA